MSNSRQELNQFVDLKAVHYMEPTLVDELIQEAHGGDLTPKIGTARWANPIHAANAYPYEPGAIWLGRNPVNNNQSMGYKDDRHVLVCAGTRTGKGRTIIVNNLALWPGSICTIDPKGENATLLANRRGQGSEYCDGIGQEVFVFDPFECAQIPAHMRAYFDPISTLDADDPALPRKVGRVAEAMTIIPEGESAEWAKRGRQMISTIILHVVTSPDFDGVDAKERPYRSLVTVRRLITAGDTRAYEQLKEMGADSVPPAMELLWDAVAHNPAFDGIISDQGESNYQSLKHHREYFESVRKSAAENTDWIDDPQMRECLIGSQNTQNKFTPETLKSSATGQSIFLCLPVDDMPVYGRWQRVMIATVITEMQKTQGQPSIGYPLLMCMDEFPALGTMDRLEKAAAEIAGAGVKLMTVVQNLPQLQKLYKKGWETFLGNAGLQIYFGMDDNTTRGYLEKALGETEIIKHLNTQNRGTSNQVTEGETHGQSEGTTTGKSSGSNKSWQKSEGGNTSNQISSGTNTSTGSSSGTNTSNGTSNSSGSSWNTGQSGGTSSGLTYAPYLFFRSAQNYNEGANSGWSSGSGGNNSHSTNQGSGQNWSQNSSAGQNRSQSQGTGKNWSNGTGGGENWSESAGTSQQTQFSRQNSNARGTTQGESIAESVHKRPLLPANEADKAFALISDKDHFAYPGLALVKISGQDAMFVRKTNYDEDQAFMRCFDPHPAHPYIALEEEPDLLPEPLLIETRDTFESKTFLGKKFNSERDALIHFTKQNGQFIEHPSKGTRWNTEFSISVDLSSEFIWDVLTETKYLGFWNPWVAEPDGKSLPDEFDSGDFISDNYSQHKIVWCEPNKRLVMSDSNCVFYEVELTKITDTKTTVTVKSYRFGVQGKNAFFGTLNRGTEALFSKMIKKNNNNAGLSAKYDIREAAMRLKRRLNEVKSVGKIIDLSEIGQRFFSLTWGYSPGIFRENLDEDGNALLRSGNILPEGCRYGYVIADGVDEEEQFFREQYPIRSHNYLPIEILDIFIEDGEHVEMGELIATGRVTTELPLEEIYNTGVNYYNGDGVEQNYVQAAAWFTKAASQNHPSAINNLATLYNNGLGVSKKKKLAVKLLEKAAKLGNKTTKKANGP